MGAFMKSTRSIYDIEVYPNLLLVCFKDYESGEKKHYYCYVDPVTGEKINQIPELTKHILNRCQWLVGYNNHDYDDIIIKSLYIDPKTLNTSDASVVVNHCYSLSQRIIICQSKEEHFPDSYLYTKIKKFESYDVIELLNTIDRTSLKQLAINLRWHRIQDLPYPPDTYIKREQLDAVIDYCYNDVNILEAALNYYSPIINERVKFSKLIGSDVNNKNDTDIAKLVLATHYEKVTGIPYATFSKQRTYYERVALNRCISPKIKFVTRKYQRLLEKVQEIVINPNVKETTSKKKKQFDLTFWSKYLSHTLGLGGIHSNNPSEILEDDGDAEYWDLDVTSYYPRIMINERYQPRHLDKRFLDIYDEEVVSKRVWAKAHKQKVLALFLKITANGTFGLTKSEYSWLYDPYVTYSTTVSGQLFLMMLLEAIEHYTKCVIVYSNTDGLTVKVPAGQRNAFMKCCQHWMSATGFDLEFNRYKKMIVQDVNNYLIFYHGIVDDKHYKAKGSYLWSKPITKGYENPIVAKAVFAYFDKGIPIADTITQAEDIYDFMIAERTNQKTFKVVLQGYNEEDTQELQKNNRWIITKGDPKEGKLYKYDRETNERTEMQKDRLVRVLNDVPSKNAKDYKLDYDYYIGQAQMLINLKPSTRPDEVVEPLVQAKLF